MWSNRTSEPFEEHHGLYECYKTPGSSGWSLPSNGNRGRRLSAASDSGDTGFGTSCSDSVEEQSSSSTSGPSSFHRPAIEGSPGGPNSSPSNMRQSGGSPGGGVPTAHVMPRPSLSSSSSFSSGLATANAGVAGGGHHSPFWGGSCHQLLPDSPSSVTSSATPTLPSPLDMRDPRPVRRWSSLTRLSAGSAEKPSSRAAPVYRCSAGAGGLSDRGTLLYGCTLSSQDQHHHGSLDRGLLYGYGGSRSHVPIAVTTDSSSGSSPSLLLAEPLGYDPPPRYHRYEHRTSTAASVGADSSPLSSSLSSPLKPSSLDLNYGALPESSPRLLPSCPPGHRDRAAGTPCSSVGAGSPIQTSVRTQMWLSEQMEQYRPPPPGGGGGALEQGAWPQQRHHQEAELNQMLSGTSLPVNTLVKIKEGLLRQRELEIDRQKQQILQLHARIRENELRAQQVLHGQRGRCDDSYLLNTKDSLPYDGPCGATTTTAPTGSPAPSSERGPAPPPCCERRHGELARKLAAAEQEALTLSDFLKHNAQKYSDDLKKMEDKIKTRDRYIVSLKKKCQREVEQSAERQQRIETLEKYLAELPCLQGVETELSTAQQRCADLESQLCALELRRTETHNQLAQKDLLIDSQNAREAELVATVHTLQQKIERCLDDGVRLPVMSLKHLEEENTHLLESRTHHSKVIDSQKKQIDRLSQELTATERRLQLQKDVTQQLQDRQNQRHGETAPPAVDSGVLLREMCQCLLDLQALCSVLVQRACGQTPNISLLLGIQSMSVSGEEVGVDNAVPLGQSDDGGGSLLRDKLLQVAQLRRDIDELRRSMSDRYAQDMGESCITQ